MLVVAAAEGRGRVQPAGAAQLEAPPRRAALTLQCRLTPRAGCRRSAPAGTPLLSPSARTSLPGHSLGRRSGPSRCCEAVARLLRRAAPRRAVRREEAGGVQPPQLLPWRAPRFAQTRCSLQLLAQVEGRVVAPPHHVSPAPCPRPSGANSVPVSWSCPEGPLAVPRSAWSDRPLADALPKAWDVERPSPFQGRCRLPWPGAAGGLRRNLPGAGRGMGDCILPSLSGPRRLWRAFGNQSRALSPARFRSATTASCTRSGEGPTRKSA